MVGDAVDMQDRTLPSPGEIVLCARELQLHGTSSPIEVIVRAGEIVGLAGLVGSGALEIGSALAGAARAASGTLSVRGQAIPIANRTKAAALGVGYVPSDRHAEGLFAVLPALQNASASSIRTFSRNGVLDQDAETERLVPWLRRLKLHPFRTELKAENFSGGNQQKLLIARNLALPHLCALVVLDPTRGVDIAARETIHEAIVEAAHRGVAVILASSDLDEVMALSHRILVVRHGHIEGELPGGTDRASLMRALAGKAAA
jgi:ABC-type sugar transport system ATPase subunit